MGRRRKAGAGMTGAASLCAALLLCGACAYQPPPVPPAEVIQPPGRQTVCAEAVIDDQGNCRKSLQSHYRPPPVPPAEFIQPSGRRSVCAEMLIDKQGNCRKSSRSHGLASANIGIARRRPMGRIPPDRDARSTAYVVFTVKNASVGSVFLGVPATFSPYPSGVLGGGWSDFFPQRLEWSDRAVTP
jgi:hypothetical protein